jgi:hypothetical protein
LLKPIKPPDIPVEEKERLIQAGRKHYSEMLTHEHRPSAGYEELFLAQTKRHKKRLAQDIINLAETIRVTHPAPITLVSLARAGTPIGALLQRALTRCLDVPARHFSISIIRDRGIDEQALMYLLRVAKRPPEGVVFVDGWTAKGVIARQLQESIAHWNRRQPEHLSGRLHVVADLSGVADVAASGDDYIIPSGILGATVSGLVSRSILNEQIAATDFHGCLFYEHLRGYDYSTWFLDTISQEMEELVPSLLPHLDQMPCYSARQQYLLKLQRDYRITNINYIKPGVLEASRVLLRRAPGLLLLAEAESPDVAHLQLLAAEKGVAVHYDEQMPFRGVALIKTL